MFRQEEAPARKSRGFPISQVAALGWLGNETAPLCLRRLNVLWRVEFPRCSAGREKEAPLKVEREKRAAQYLPRSRATGGTPGPGGSRRRPHPPRRPPTASQQRGSRSKVSRRSQTNRGRFSAIAKVRCKSLSHMTDCWCGRRESNSHDPCGSQDFKSCVSTCSTTSASGQCMAGERVEFP